MFILFVVFMFILYNPILLGEVDNNVELDNRKTPLHIKPVTSILFIYLFIKVIASKQLGLLFVLLCFYLIVSFMYRPINCFMPGYEFKSYTKRTLTLRNSDKAQADFERCKAEMNKTRLELGLPLLIGDEDTVVDDKKETSHSTTTTTSTVTIRKGKDVGQASQTISVETKKSDGNVVQHRSKKGDIFHNGEHLFGKEYTDDVYNGHIENQTSTDTTIKNNIIYLPEPSNNKSDPHKA